MLVISFYFAYLVIYNILTHIMSINKELIMKYILMPLHVSSQK